MLERLALLVRLQSSGRKPGGINSRIVGIFICVCVVGLGVILINLSMPLDSETPASKADFQILNKKMDAILFAQTEILLRQRQTASESLHAPLYIWEALLNEVGVVQDELTEAVNVARRHLEKLREERQ